MPLCQGFAPSWCPHKIRSHAAQIRAYPSEIIDEEPLIILGETERAALGLACEELIYSCFRLIRGDEDWVDVDLSEYLPPRYALKYDGPFYERMCISLVQVAEKLAGIAPILGILPATLGEELALHALLEHARARWQELIELDLLKDAEPIYRRTPDFWMVTEVAFRDTDFLWLYNDAADGIDESPVGSYQGMAPQDFASWFTITRGDYLPHPYLRSAE